MPIRRTPSIDATEGRDRDWKVKDDFGHRAENIWVRGDNRVRLVTSKSDGGRRQGEAVCRSQ